MRLSAAVSGERRDRPALVRLKVSFVEQKSLSFRIHLDYRVYTFGMGANFDPMLPRGFSAPRQRTDCITGTPTHEHALANVPIYYRSLPSCCPSGPEMLNGLHSHALALSLFVDTVMREKAHIAIG